MGRPRTRHLWRAHHERQGDRLSGATALLPRNADDRIKDPKDPRVGAAVLIGELGGLRWIDTMSVRAVPLSGDDRERPEGSFGRPLAGGVGGCNGERVGTGVELPRARQPALEEQLMRASAGVERERAYGHAAGARL